MKNFQKNVKALEASDTQVLGVSMVQPVRQQSICRFHRRDLPPAERLGRQDVEKVRGVVQTLESWANEASRRVTYLIDKSGRIAEVQVDEAAIDPAKIVQACERKKHGG